MPRIGAAHVLPPLGSHRLRRHRRAPVARIRRGPAQRREACELRRGPDPGQRRLVEGLLPWLKERRRRRFGGGRHLSGGLARRGRLSRGRRRLHRDLRRLGCRRRCWWCRRGLDRQRRIRPYSAVWLRWGGGAFLGIAAACCLSNAGAALMGTAACVGCCGAAAGTVTDAAMPRSGWMWPSPGCSRLGSTVSAVGGMLVAGGPCMVLGLRRRRGCPRSQRRFCLHRRQAGEERRLRPGRRRLHLKRRKDGLGVRRCPPRRPRRGGSARGWHRRQRRDLPQGSARADRSALALALVAAPMKKSAATGEDAVEVAVGVAIWAGAS